MVIDLWIEERLEARSALITSKTGSFFLLSINMCRSTVGGLGDSWKLVGDFSTTDLGADRC